MGLYLAGCDPLTSFTHTQTHKHRGEHIDTDSPAGQTESGFHSLANFICSFLTGTVFSMPMGTSTYDEAWMRLSVLRLCLQAPLVVK